MKYKLFALPFLSLLLSASLSAAERGGREVRAEADRGTVRMPDFVAVPHDEEAAPKIPVARTPNKSLATDLNADGYISRDEWKGTVDDFTRLDANEDETLSQRELDSYVQLGTDKFAEMDADRDGRLTKNEWKEASHFFRQLDRNKDGALSRGEYYFEGPRRGGVLTHTEWEEQ